jgi:peptidoglycan/LPS O-acetylase OafA/YrhL
MSVFRTVAVAIGSLPDRLGRVDSRSYIPELDGLRCLAIMIVLLWHASLRAARYIDHVNQVTPGTASLYRFFPHGEIGVVLFFFVSGFVVSQPFVTRPMDKWRLGQFVRRRFLRIYPPYLIVILGCYAALAIFGHAPTDAYAFQQSTIGLDQSLLASLFYLHGVIFNAPPRLNPPMWSLEIEVAFYVILPLFMWVYCRFARPRRVMWLAIAICLVVAVSSFFLISGDTDLRLRFGFFGHAFLFLVGIATADFVGESIPRHQKNGNLGDFIFLSGVVLIAAVGFEMTQNDARMIDGVYAVAMQSAMVAAMLLMFFGALQGKRAARFLSMAYVRLIGTMCYSIYLTHIIVMTAAAELLGRVFHSRDVLVIYPVFLGVLISVSLLFGTVFYVLVERPIARYIARPRRVTSDLSMTSSAVRQGANR